MEVLDAIKLKRAVRTFSSQPIDERELQIIVNAGRRAQSAKNMQPWDFIVIQKRETLLDLSRMGTYAAHLAGAAAGIVIVTLPPETRFSVMFDAGQSAAYMQLAAWSLGIGSSLATIYQPEEARRRLNFPEDRVALIALSFGYPADPSEMWAASRKGGRRSLAEVVHREQW